MGDIYDVATYQPKKSLGSLLGRVRVEMLTALDRELSADKRLAPLELSAAQFIIIANLAGAEEPKSASDLCKGISYDAGAMTRMLDRLESKGLIRRNRSAHDRRLMHLELTDEGRAAYPRMREISMARRESLPAWLYQDRGPAAGGASGPHARERPGADAARQRLSRQRFFFREYLPRH